MKTATIYSDLYLTRTVKIEILPTDKLEQKDNFFVVGDKLVSVFRPVRTPQMAEVLNKFFFAELESRHVGEQLLISEALQATIHACNVSQLNFMGNPESAPESGSMVMAVYINPKNQFTITQVGDITLKQRQNGRFIALTENHTFDNPLEVERLAKFLKQSGATTSSEAIVSTIATDEGFVDKVPSRFIGHPNWCTWGGEYGESLINTQPFVTTFST